MWLKNDHLILVYCWFFQWKITNHTHEGHTCPNGGFFIERAWDRFWKSDEGINQFSYTLCAMDGAGNYRLKACILFVYLIQMKYDDLNDAKNRWRLKYQNKFSGLLGLISVWEIFSHHLIFWLVCSLRNSTHRKTDYLWRLSFWKKKIENFKIPCVLQRKTFENFNKFQ